MLSHLGGCEHPGPQYPASRLTLRSYSAHGSQHLHAWDGPAHHEVWTQRFTEPCARGPCSRHSPPRAAARSSHAGLPPSNVQLVSHTLKILGTHEDCVVSSNVSKVSWAVLLSCDTLPTVLDAGKALALRLLERANSSLGVSANAVPGSWGASIICLVHLLLTIFGFCFNFLFLVCFTP